MYGDGGIFELPTCSSLSLLAGLNIHFEHSKVTDGHKGLNHSLDLNLQR